MTEIVELAQKRPLPERSRAGLRKKTGWLNRPTVLAAKSCGSSSNPKIRLSCIQCSIGNGLITCKHRALRPKLNDLW